MARFYMNDSIRSERSSNECLCENLRICFKSNGVTLKVTPFDYFVLLFSETAPGEAAFSAEPCLFDDAEPCGAGALKGGACGGALSGQTVEQGRDAALHLGHPLSRLGYPVVNRPIG